MNKPTEDQIAALKRLWNIARRDHGGAGVVAHFLLGLYNGARFPFDLNDLRRLDSDVLQDVLTVLVMDCRPWSEVHALLNLALNRSDMGMRFELLACTWRMKGKCSKADEKELRERLDLGEPFRMRAEEV